MLSLPKKEDILSTFSEKKLDRRSLFSLFLILQLVVLLVYQSLTPHIANAALTGYLRLDRLGASAALSGAVCEQPSSAGNNQSQVKVTFPSTFTVSGTAVNWSVDTTASNLPASTTPWPGIAAPSQDASISGKTVTFIGNGLASSSTTYCFHFSASSSDVGSANSTATGTIITYTSAAALIDQVDYATDIVSSGSDQITVTATVPPTFSFSLSGNSVNLGTLNTTTPNSGTVSATLSTNAYLGWMAWVKSANAALSSVTSGGSIASNGSYPTITSLASTSGYVLDAQPGTGLSSGNIDTGYYGNAADSGGHLDTQFRQVASHNVPASGDQVSFRFRARASATTKAASDYSDTVTVVAAGSF